MEIYACTHKRVRQNRNGNENLCKPTAKNRSIGVFILPYIHTHAHVNANTYSDTDVPLSDVDVSA